MHTTYLTRGALMGHAGRGNLHQRAAGWGLAFAASAAFWAAFVWAVTR